MRAVILCGGRGVRWSAELVDTGEDTDTGDLVLQCLDRMGEAFFATYGDGFGNVDITALAARHHRRLAIRELADTA